jgi:RND family efflux transporter MFP subunit
MNSMKKFLRLISLASMGALLTAACSSIQLPGMGPRTAQTNGVSASAERVTAEQGVIEKLVIGNGSIAARSTSDVPFLRSGLVANVSAAEGTFVEKGDVLAQLDTSDLESAVQSAWMNFLSARISYSQTLRGPSELDIAAAQAQLKSAQASYDALSAGPTETDIRAAQADLQNAEAALKQAQAAYDRRAGRDPGVAASSEALSLEQATNNYAKAKATYDARFAKPTQAQFAAAAAQIASARKSLDALTTDDLASEAARIKMDQAYTAWEQAVADVGEATLKAPIDGLVVAVNVAAGEFANSGGVAVQLVDFSEPLFEVALDEADLQAVQVGQEARVRLQAYIDQSISATVDSIAVVGASSNNIVTYKVKLRIPRVEGQPNILLNMSGTSEIVTGKIADAVMVPTAALIVDTTNKTYAVFKVNGTDVQRTVVEIGEQSGSSMQILSGVAAGDVLAVPSVATQSVSAGGPGGGGPPPGQ